MPFNFFGGSNTKSKEDFTKKKGAKYSPPPGSKSTAKTKPRTPPCPQFAYIPHHRNLGLKPGAFDDEIKNAWRALSLGLHPDRIRDPSKKQVAQEAMILVNGAYERLYEEEKKMHEPKQPGGTMSFYEKVMSEKPPDRDELYRRAKEYLLSERSEKLACDAVVKRKPWFWNYKRQANCRADGNYLCGEFWATLTHDVVDGNPYSDWIWHSIDKNWTFPTMAPEQPGAAKTLILYGPCGQTYTLDNLKLPRPLKPMFSRWSTYHNSTCNTALDMYSFDGFVLIAISTILIAIAAFLTVVSRWMWAPMLLAIGRVVIWCIKAPFRFIFWVVWKIYRFFTWPMRKIFYQLCKLWAREGYHERSGIGKSLPIRRPGRYAGSYT